MQQKTAPVSWRKPTPQGKVTEKLGDVIYWQYDSLEEAAQHLGAERALERLNAQIETDAKNEFRAAKRPGEPTKAVLLNMANERIAARGDLAQIVAAATAEGKNPLEVIQQLVADEVEKIKAELKAKRESGEVVEDDDNDDSESSAAA